MSMDIATLGLKVDARQIREGDQALDRFATRAQRAEQAIDKFTKTQQRLATGLKAVVAALAFDKLVQFTRALYDAGAASERLQRSMSFSFGASAGREFEYLKRMTREMGLEFQTTATAYGKLQAAARGTSVAGEGARKIFESITKASVTMGLSVEQTGGALTAIEQMISKGTVSAEELRGQLGERLPGAFQIASRAMGKTTQELGKMLEQGEVIAEDFLPKFAAQLEKEIGDSATKAADSLDAATNRMGNAFKRLMTAAAESGIADFLKDLKNAFANDLNAIAEAMERAKRGGSGTLGQLNAGTGMAIGRVMNLQHFSDDFKTVDAQLKSALATVERLESKKELTLFEKSRLEQAHKRVSQLTSELHAAEGAANDMNAQDARLLAAGKVIVEQEKAKAKGAADLAETRRKLYGVDKDYLSTLQNLQSQLDAGQISQTTYIDLVSKLAEKNYRKADSDRASGKAARDAAREIDRQDDILAKLSGTNADYQEQLERLQAARVRLNMSESQYVDLVTELINDQPAVKKALDAEKDAAEAVAKAYADMVEKRQRGVDDLWEQVRAREKELETYELTEGAVYDLLAAEKQRQIDSATWSPEKLAALNEELAAYKKLADLARMKDARDATRKAAEDARAAWEKTAEKIGDTLTDALMRGFEAGKGFARNMRDTVINLFKTMVLRTTIQAGITGAMNGARGAFQGANLINAGSNLWSGLSGGMASSFGGMVSGAGNFLGSAGLAEFGAGMQGASLAPGLMGPTTAGAGGMMGAGSTFAAAMPYLAAAAAIYSIVKSLDDSGTMHTGGAATSQAGMSRTVDARSLGFMNIDTTEQANQAAAGIASGIVSILDSTATTFGKQAGFAAATAFADDTSKDGAWGALRIERNGQKLLDWDDTRASRWAPREYGDGEAGRNAYVADIAKSVRDALDSIGLPAWAEEMLDNLGAAPSIEQLGQVVEQINAAQTALANMAAAMPAFAAATDATVSALVKASGGIGAFVGNMDAFYQGYFTESERMSVMAGQVRKALADVNVAMPTTRAEFRGLVEHYLSLGEAGAPTVAALLRVSTAFGTVADYANRAGDAVAESGSSIKTLREKMIEGAEAAFRSLSRAIDAERNAVTEAYERQSDAVRKSIETVTNSVNKLRSLSGALGNALARMQAPGMQGIDRMVAMSQIQGAIAIARAGGALPDAENLQLAIDRVATVSEDQYSSAEAYYRDFYAAAIALDDLKQLTDAELTIEERTLEALNQQVQTLDANYASTMRYYDDMLAKAQLELDALHGIDTRLMSVASALAGFGAAAGAARAVGAGSANVTNGLTGIASDASLNERLVQGMYSTIFNRVGEASGVAYWVDKLNQGMSILDLEAGFKNSPEYKGFANGGTHTGGWRAVGERAIELAYTGPQNVVSNNDMHAMLDQSGTQQEVKELREYMERALFTIAKNTGDSADTLRKFDRTGITTNAATTEETA